MSGDLSAGHDLDSLRAEYGSRWTFAEAEYLDGIMIVAKPYPPTHPFLAIVRRTPSEMAAAIHDYERQLARAGLA